MRLSNSKTKYGSVAKSFHWITAGLILFLLPLGIYMRYLPRDTTEEIAQVLQLYSLHKTLGVLAFFIAILRVLWALRGPKPKSLQGDNQFESFAAELVHWMLYIAILATPLAGWLHHAATTGFAPIRWPFGQGLPLVPVSQTLAQVFSALHFVLALMMGGSILVHIGGALKHFLIDRDKTLQRMLPFVAVETPDVGSTPHKRLPAMMAFVVLGLVGIAGVMLNAPKPLTGEATQLAATASQWRVDPENSALAISIRQFGATVSGSFANWSADITFDPDDLPNANVSVTIAIDSLTLGSVADTALGFDYFDATTFATALWESDTITRLDDGSYLAEGTLTLRGITAPVPLVFTLIITDTTARMSATTTIPRLDFGVGAIPMPDDASLGFDVVVEITLIATQ